MRALQTKASKSRSASIRRCCGNCRIAPASCLTSAITDCDTYEAVLATSMGDDMATDRGPLLSMSNSYERVDGELWRDKLHETHASGAQHAPSKKDESCANGPNTSREHKYCNLQRVGATLGVLRCVRLFVAAACAGGGGRPARVLSNFGNTVCTATPLVPPCQTAQYVAHHM